MKPQLPKTAAAFLILSTPLLIAAPGDSPDEVGSDASTPPLVEIDVEFPRPLFIGTPVPAVLPNLEKPGRPRLTLQAPEGSTNLASDKPVTSSTEVIIFGDLEMITDGEKAGIDGTYVELDPGLQWVQIDLEEKSNIYSIALWHFHKQAAAYLDVVVQLSDDPEFKDGTTVTVFNNDHDNTSDFGKGGDPTYIETNHGRLIDVDGTPARYVRLSSQGNTSNDLNHYVEVEIWGLPSE